MIPAPDPELVSKYQARVDANKVEISNLLNRIVPKDDNEPSEILEHNGQVWCPVSDFTTAIRQRELFRWQCEQTWDSLFFHQLINEAMVNEFKARGINPFEVLTNADV